MDTMNTAFAAMYKGVHDGLLGSGCNPYYVECQFLYVVDRWAE